eukprot:scaffold39905_cov80-Phaeocystis_antarctica.AAC.2
MMWAYFGLAERQDGQRGDGCKFKRRAHPISLISVHVGVGQRCRAFDNDPPAMLPTMRAHT